MLIAGDAMAAGAVKRSGIQFESDAVRLFPLLLTALHYFPIDTINTSLLTESRIDLLGASTVHWLGNSCSLVRRLRSYLERK